MNRTIRFFHVARCACLAAAVVAGFTLQARAGFVGSAVEITFDTGSQSGSFVIDLANQNDPYQWQLPAPITVFGSGESPTALATIRELSVTFDGDPGVSLAFNVTASSVLTHVTVLSTTIAFTALNNPLAFATAALTVTDLDSSPGGAAATGLLPGSRAYQAQYNGSSVFANLVSPVSAATDESSTGSERLPVSGTMPILGTVGSIQSKFDFMLTANDSASGTSRFNVVPEPSAMVLAVMGLGGLLACRMRGRRRRLGGK